MGALSDPESATAWNKNSIRFRRSFHKKYFARRFQFGRGIETDGAMSPPSLQASIKDRHGSARRTFGLSARGSGKSGELLLSHELQIVVVLKNAWPGG
jgi:hypothetical protein